MINLSQKYALLEDGTIEPLWFEFDETEQRTCYYEEGVAYLDHDRCDNPYLQKRCHHRILATANTKKELYDEKEKQCR